MQASIRGISNGLYKSEIGSFGFFSLHFRFWLSPFILSVWSSFGSLYHSFPCSFFESMQRQPVSECVPFTYQIRNFAAVDFPLTLISPEGPLEACFLSAQCIAVSIVTALSAGYALTIAAPSGLRSECMPKLSLKLTTKLVPKLEHGGVAGDGVQLRHWRGWQRRRGWGGPHERRCACPASRRVVADAEPAMRRCGRIAPAASLAPSSSITQRFKQSRKVTAARIVLRSWK